MKKNDSSEPIVSRIGSSTANHAVKKWLLLMKLITFFCFIGIVQSQAATYDSVNFDQKAVTLEQVFGAIRKQLDYDIFYSNEELNAKEVVYLSSKTMGLKSVLKEALGNKYTYEVIDKTIVIRPMKQAQKPQSVKEEDNVVKGKVIDNRGNAIPGVTVRVDSTTFGTATNAKGEFTLNMKLKKGNLIFSFIGFKTRKVPFVLGKTMKVVLEEEATEMDEVVVNGMFTQNKNSFTGSVTTMKSEDILAISNTNLVKAISILSPGMRLMENNEMGSNPNHIPEIIIRGTTSIASNGEYGLNTPLIVMDGVEISMQQLYDLDIYEIDRIDVLKDASATAIYGEKAANGVIVIERKKVTDKKLKLRYNFVPGFEFPDVDSYHYCNAEQKLELERLAGLYNTADGSLDEDYNRKLKRIRKGANTDWLAKPLRNSTSFNHSLTMSGRGGGMDYSVTARYSDKRGVMKGDYRENVGLGFYFSYRLVDKLTLTYRADIAKTNSKNSPYGAFSDFVRLNPYDTPFNEYGEWNKKLSYDMANPLYNASTSSFNKANSESLTNNINARWDIRRGLYVTGSFSYTTTKTETKNFISPDHSNFEEETDPTKKGHYMIASQKGKSWASRVGITYSQNLDDKGSIITLNAGTSANKSNSNNYNFSGVGFLKGNLTDMAFASKYPEGHPSGSESLNTSVGFYANLNVIFRNRYFMDGSYRVSGSSKFGKDERFAPYWSLGLGWNAHNENFMKNWEIFDIFRLRGSMGYTGSINFSDYQAITTYKYDSDNNYLVSMGANPITMGNDNLKWQTTVKYNVGLTVEMFKGRLSANFDYYKENTKDL